MPKFVMLSTLGPEGSSRLRDNPSRLKEVNADVEAMGVKVLAQYALLGMYDFLNILLNGKSILPKNGDNFSYFDNPTFNDRMDKAAALTGDTRATTYGNIATDMKTQQAPWAAWSNQTNYDFFSSRIGCQLWEPSYGMDIAALCVK